MNVKGACELISATLKVKMSTQVVSGCPDRSGPEASICSSPSPVQRDSDPADYHRYEKENLRNKPNLLHH